MFRKPRDAESQALVGQTVDHPRPALLPSKSSSRNGSILNFFKKVETVQPPLESNGLFIATTVGLRRSSTGLESVDDDISRPPVKADPLPVRSSADDAPAAKRRRMVGPFAEDSDDEGAGLADDNTIDDLAEDDQTDEIYDDFPEVDLPDEQRGEEYIQMKWLERQEQLELLDDFQKGSEECAEQPAGSVTECPLCMSSLAKLSEEEIARHVNRCLDGEAPPVASSPVKNDPPRITPPKAGTLPKLVKADSTTESIKLDPPPKLVKAESTAESINFYPDSPASLKPEDSTDSLPTDYREDSPTKSILPPPITGATAFARIMKGNVEDTAWAAAAAEEAASRGKPAAQRSCPFYKIMPGFNICVDAFRYGAVPGCKAYFLSHFHSDHYIGLHHTWCHGPIYCSKVTANLVRQQLRVDPRWVVDLEFEKKQLVPGTNGVSVTMISANHCPGSSLFLFEKDTGRRLHRVLHCGDFRASPDHIRHPLLRPDGTDLQGRAFQQKLDVCYLDTTYLNPKYAFPEQAEVIKSCADLCVSINSGADRTGSWALTRAGAVRESSTLPDPGQERLLVVIGTYSIGKERICVGIAKALGSKIYASAGKARICSCLEDPELDALLTRDPHEAQVHMTPLMEIRAETLHEYLQTFKPRFTKVIGFRPSGWTYRPPTGRFIESPAVSAVLSSDNWVSRFASSDLVPQRGSSKEAQCYGVPYSEHSSFRELTMFCCALRIDKIIPTVNIGSAKSRDKMKAWIEKWAAERKKNGLFSIPPDQVSWHG